MIYFSDQDAADNFFCEYNVRNFPAAENQNNKKTTTRSEFLYCSFIDKIYKYKYTKAKAKAKAKENPKTKTHTKTLLSTENKLDDKINNSQTDNEMIKFEKEEQEEPVDSNKNNIDLALNLTSNYSSCDLDLNKTNSILLINDEELNTIIHFNMNISYADLSELSACPLCLERLDISASGITSIKTTSRLINNERWKNYKKHCAVCSKLSSYNFCQGQKQVKENAEKPCVVLIKLPDDQEEKKDSAAAAENKLANALTEENSIASINIKIVSEKINKDSDNVKLNNFTSGVKRIENLTDNYVKCNVCATHNNLWLCLICGATGCDRYNLGHAVEHFRTTYHRYSIDMTHERIWDYKDDKWVHRVLKITETKNENNNLNNNLTNNNNNSSEINNNTENNNENSNYYFDNENNTNESNNNRPAADFNLINLEDENNGNSQEENLNTKEFLMRIENIICEYNFVLSEQLEQQRLYYENEILKITEKNEELIKDRINQANALHEQAKALSEKNESDKRMVKEYNKKLNQQSKKMEEIEENKKLTIEMTKNLKDDVKYLEEKNVIFVYISFCLLFVYH